MKIWWLITKPLNRYDEAESVWVWEYLPEGEEESHDLFMDPGEQIRCDKLNTHLWADAIFWFLGSVLMTLGFQVQSDWWDICWHWSKSTSCCRDRSGRGKGCTLQVPILTRPRIKNMFSSLQYCRQLQWTWARVAFLVELTEENLNLPLWSNQSSTCLKLTTSFLFSNVYFSCRFCSTMFHWLLAVFLLILPFLILRALLPRPPSGKVCNLNEKKDEEMCLFTKVSTTLVLGSGGHTAELLGLVGASYSIQSNIKCWKILLPYQLLPFIFLEYWMFKKLVIFMHLSDRNLGPLSVQPKNLLPCWYGQTQWTEGQGGISHSMQRFEQFWFKGCRGEAWNWWIFYGEGAQGQRGHTLSNTIIHSMLHRVGGSVYWKYVSEGWPVFDLLSALNSACCSCLLSTSC